jgi:type I restriction enzyme R subunit
MLANEELANKIANNSKENVETVFDKYFDKEMLFLLQNNLDFFKKISDNEELKMNLKKELLNLVYEEKKKNYNRS